MTLLISIADKITLLEFCSIGKLAAMHIYGYHHQFFDVLVIYGSIRPLTPDKE